jgi:hypothetical protein
MNRILLVGVAAAAVFLTGTAFASAQSSTSRQTSGHEMQRKGSVKGQPGASGYAPGHEMQQKGSKFGEPGASGFAPGHETTGQGTRRGDRDHDADDRRK